jgi:topoisomerase-4 subunit A
MKGFQSVTAVEVIASNQKLYVNRADGFAGYGMRRDEYICDCSELDDVIVIRKDGKALVSRIQEKAFMGKDILYVGIYKKGDDRMVYNLIYSDARTGKGFAKRFNLPGVIRDKEYDLTQGEKNSRIHYVSGNPNGEAEVVEVKLSPASTARKKIFLHDFADVEVKGRAARGITITKYPIRKVDFLKAGSSTLSKLNLWYDADAGRLNKDRRGRYLGKFDGDDNIIAFMRNGSYRITNYDLTNRYEPERVLHVEKFHPEKPIAAVYVDGETKQYMVKRFMIETSTADKEFVFISEAIGSRLVAATTAESPEIEIEVNKGKDKPKKTETVNLEDLVDIKGWKALGNRLSEHKVTRVTLVQDDEPGYQEAGEDAEEEVAESEDDSQSPKKKIGPSFPQQRPEPPVGEDGQVVLFAEPEKKQKHPLAQSPAPNRKAFGAKIKVEQQNLFGESQPRQEDQQNSPAQKNESKEKNEVEKGDVIPVLGPEKAENNDENVKNEGKSFNVGETIEFEL